MIVHKKNTYRTFHTRGKLPRHLYSLLFEDQQVGIIYGERRSVAIKIISLHQQGASKCFIDECNALRSVNYCDLLKIFIACSIIDHQEYNKLP